MHFLTLNYAQRFLLRCSLKLHRRTQHHLSHFFEITGIVDNTPYLPHGIDVVYSTLITSALREEIINSKFPDNQHCQPRNERESEINRVYKQVADGCIALQDKLGTYEKNRIAVYNKNEKEIKRILSEVPKTDELKNILANIGLDMKEFYSTYSKDKIKDAIRYAKDLKDRYTVLWMYYDLGLGD